MPGSIYSNGSSLLTDATSVSHYIEGSTISNYISWDTGNVTFGNSEIGGQVTKESGIAPQLYFKYIKKHFGLLEQKKIEDRKKKLERAFDTAVENGQNVLAEKFLCELARETRECALFARGVTTYIEQDIIRKYKNSIRGGHISDTQLKDFTRVIPKKVLEKKKKVEDLFDGFVVYHYWNDRTQDKIAEKQKMSHEEKAKMRDPVLFGWIKESSRLYFIADWEDEYCDLTFDEIVDAVGKESVGEITKEPKLNV